MNGRPFILWKCAASLDGRIAAADGSSKWITSEESRADGHRLRAECGAVMVGSGTQQADDPQLAERSQQDQDEGPGRYCTPAYVEIQRAATWIELGRPERAINLFHDSLARLSSVHRRDRGVYLARLASAYALSGSPDISVRKGWEALTVAQATGSRRITTELVQLGSRLSRWESMPEVGQLLKELPAA